jgi:hypothetical protein
MLILLVGGAIAYAEARDEEEIPVVPAENCAPEEQGPVGPPPMDLVGPVGPPPMDLELPDYPEASPPPMATRLGPAGPPPMDLELPVCSEDSPPPMATRLGPAGPPQEWSPALASEARVLGRVDISGTLPPGAEDWHGPWYFSSGEWMGIKITWVPAGSWVWIGFWCDTTGTSFGVTGGQGTLQGWWQAPRTGWFWAGVWNRCPSRPIVYSGFVDF